MQDQQNLDVVNQIYAAFGRGDMPALVALLDPHVTWVTPGPADLPTAGSRRGPDQVLDFFRTLMGMMEIIRFTPTDLLAKDDTVVVLGEEEGRMKATGRTLLNRWVHVFRLRDGKV